MEEGLRDSQLATCNASAGTTAAGLHFAKVASTFTACWPMQPQPLCTICSRPSMVESAAFYCMCVPQPMHLTAMPFKRNN